MKSFLLAALIAGPPCDDSCEMSRGVLLRDEDSFRYLKIDGPEGESACYSQAATHEGDRDPMPIGHAIGRTVVRCRTHAKDPVIVGGMPPRDYTMMVTISSWVAETRPKPSHRSIPGPTGEVGEPASFDGTLVDRLGSPLYATRRAAHATLVNRGPAAVDALLAGLGREPETRERCRLILEEIRTGMPMDP